jgi:hypothetical protein
MQFKAVKPAHTALAHLSDSFKSLVPPDALIMAHPKNGRVNEGNAGTFASAAVMQKEHKGHCTALAQFYKAIIGDKPWKILLEVNAGIMNVEELKVTEPTAVEGNEQSNDFRITKGGFPVSSFDIGTFRNQVLFDGFFKKKTKIIYGNENFGNFVLKKWCVHLLFNCLEFN